MKISVFLLSILLLSIDYKCNNPSKVNYPVYGIDISHHQGYKIKWDKLKAEIRARRVRVVVLDLPTSWQMMASERSQDLTSRIFEAINDMLLDMLAAVARKDYEDRRRRTMQGIEKAKAGGLYKGRPEDAARNKAIIDLLKGGKTWASIIAATGCSRSTLARLTKRVVAPI